MGHLKLNNYSLIIMSFKEGQGSKPSLTLLFPFLLFCSLLSESRVQARSTESKTSIASGCSRIYTLISWVGLGEVT